MSTPLPLSWVHKPLSEDDDNFSSLNLKPRDLATFGRVPSLGTKSRLRLQLMSSGWYDVEAIDHVLASEKRAFRVEEHLVDIDANSLSLTKPEDLLEVFASEAGLRVGLKAACDGGRMGVFWRTLTSTPWWSTVRSMAGYRNIIIVGQTSSILERTSAALIRDVWCVLGAPPLARMVKFKRLSLDAWRGGAWNRGSLDDEDILIVQGGTHWNLDDSIASFAALSAIRACFGGMLVYEMLVHDDYTQQMGMFKRSGFGGGSTVVMGVRNSSGRARVKKVKEIGVRRREEPAKKTSVREKASSPKTYLKNKVPALRGKK